MATYAAMIDCMDQGLGRIIRTLKDCGVDQNTIVMFLSDNGGEPGQMRWDRPDITPGTVDTYCFCGPGWAFLQNTPFRGFKRQSYEGGIATPFIVRWPGKVKAGEIIHQVGLVNDIMPTLCEIAGIKYPDEHNGRKILSCEGESLVPVFKGAKSLERRWLFWEQFGYKAVRHGNWKLIGRGDPMELSHWELYDLQADRTERNDLAKKDPEMVKQMAQAWDQWNKRMETN
jgi:arylsulfatase